MKNNEQDELNFILAEVNELQLQLTSLKISFKEVYTLSHSLATFSKKYNIYFNFSKTSDSKLIGKISERFHCAFTISDKITKKIMQITSFYVDL